MLDADPSLPLSCWCGSNTRASLREGFRVCEKCGTLVRCCSPQRSSTDSAAAIARNVGSIQLQGQSGHAADAELALPVLRTLQRFTRAPARVLVVGGTGALASMISTLGFRVVALVNDNDPDFQTAEKLFDAQLLKNADDVDNIPASGMAAILLLDVVGHSADAISAVAKYVKCLDRNGVILVRTSTSRDRQGPSDCETSTDLYAFTPEALNRLLGMQGFSHIVIENINNGCSLLAAAMRRRQSGENVSEAGRLEEQGVSLGVLTGFIGFYEKANERANEKANDMANDNANQASVAPTQVEVSDDVKQLQGVVVTQARELAALRWELASLLRQNPVIARANNVKQFVRNHFPFAAEKAKRLVRAARNIRNSRRTATIAPAAAVEGQQFKAPILMLDQSEFARGLIASMPQQEVLTLRSGGGLSNIFVGTADVEGVLRPPEKGSFAEWMIEQNQLRRFRTIVVGNSDGISLSLLRGRLISQQELILTGQRGAIHPIAQELGEPNRRLNGAACYGQLPDAWLDPLDVQLRPDQLIAKPRQWPKISVVVVSFNQAEFLEEALCSVLDQDYPNLEILVVDACSNDGSADILERYRHRLDYLLIEPDKGQGDGLNKGFARATGEILTWLNSDDLLEPGALFRVAQEFTAHRVDMVVGGCRQTGVSRGDIIRNHHTKLPVGLPVALPLGLLLDVDRFWFTASFFYQPEVFFSRNIWNRSGGHLRRDLYYVLDYDLWVRMAAAGATVVHIPEFLACSRTHDQQKTTSGTLPFLPEMQRVLRKYSERLLNIEGESVAGP